jgi:hypothetical protein
MHTDTATERITLQQFITKHNIKFECCLAYSRPDGLMSNAGESHYRCSIRQGRYSFRLYFSMGIALRHAPTLIDVLDCLASDAAGYENAQSFEEWASEYGYDADSRSAEKIYRVVNRQAEQLKRVIGTDAYEELLWNTEREL